MTDKALEAALLPCPFCGGDAVVANVLTFVGVECGECGADIGCNPSSYPQDQRGPETWITEAIAAWNRRAPLSALPGEAEVVGWAYRGPRGGLIVMEEKPEHAPEAVPLVTLASLQAMQARAEKAERERDEFEEPALSCPHLDAFIAKAQPPQEVLSDIEAVRNINSQLRYGTWHYKAVAEAAEARVKELEEALREAEELIGLSEHPAFPDPAYHEEVKTLGRRIGFGALMSTASAGWREVIEEKGMPNGSEFVAGPCFGSVQRTLGIVRAALKGGSNG